MMDDERVKWARKLHNLVRRNSQLANTYKRLLEQTPEGALHDYISSQIKRGLEFQMELEEEIQNLNFDLTSFKTPLIHTAFKGRYLGTLGKNVPLLVKYSIKQKKTLLRLYQKTLTRINDGPIREKLMRHIARSEEELQELNQFESEIRTHKGFSNSMLNRE